MKHFINTFIVITIFFSSVFAAEYHVAVTGSDTTGNGTIDLPWRTPEFGAKQLTKGDVLVIHEGQYILSASNLPDNHKTMDRSRALVSPAFQVSGTLDEPIVIRAAEDDTVLLDAGERPKWAALGTNNGDYLIIRGVSVRGAVILWNSTGSMIADSNLFGGLDTPTENGGDNFGAVLRIEHCTDCIVRNNLLHDNQLGITIENSPLLIEYDSTNLIIEGNDFYNSVSIGIRLKDNPRNVIIRNNHIYNNYYSGIQGANQDTGENVIIHNNIIRQNNLSSSSSHGGITQLTHINGWKIYNNTFIDNEYADIRTLYQLEISDIQAWNNLHDNNVGNYYVIGWDSSGALFSEQWTYSNFNNFYGNGGWKERNKNWNSLSLYSNEIGMDMDSISSSPNFINRGGQKSTDFKRAAYPKNGRGGIYSDVIGAYETGQEKIGYFGKIPKAPLIEVY